MRPEMLDNSLQCMIKTLINDDVFAGYNFEGNFNRKRLKSLQFFNKVVYGIVFLPLKNVEILFLKKILFKFSEVWDPTKENLFEYNRELVKCMRRAHNRLYKKKKLVEARSFNFND